MTEMDDNMTEYFALLTDNRGKFGSRIPAGQFHGMSRDKKRNVRNLVMSSLKCTLLTVLDPRHHDQWEDIAQQCCESIVSSVKVTKRTEDGGVLCVTDARRKSEKFERERFKRIEQNHSKLLENLAQFFINQKRDNAPWELLHETVQIVRGNDAVGLVPRDEWNDAMRKVQEQELKASSRMQNDEGNINDPTTAPLHPTSLPSHDHVVNSKDTEKQFIHVSSKSWTVASDITTSAKASAVRLKHLDCEKRCKAYDSNTTIATAISLVEEEEQSFFSRNRAKKGGVASVADVDENSRKQTIYKNRLGYESAKIFCEKLDIMCKIIKHYREAASDGEKEFLLKLICDTFSREEVNMYVLPPEAQIMPPGRQRNTKLISHHRWTALRKSAGCTLQQAPPREVVLEGLRKRKRTAEEKRLSTAEC